MSILTQRRIQPDLNAFRGRRLGQAALVWMPLLLAVLMTLGRLVRPTRRDSWQPLRFQAAGTLAPPRPLPAPTAPPRTDAPVDEPRPRPWSRSIVDRRVLRGGDLVIYALLVTAWIAANAVFWVWWFQPEHVVTWPRLIVASVALAYDLTLMPAVFIFFLWQMKRPEPIRPPAGLRVAMVTAIVPSSESLSVLQRTIAAMVEVEYPHDNWVLDEGGDPRVRRLCEEFGVQYWSRAGVPEFNQPEWPFQAKTKSGNYNSWFASVAYERYDYLVQLDTDHAPVPSYLDEVLGYFADPNVAYVALPSVYWNLDDWTTRGSSEQSQVFQGPIQMGYYGWAKTPMIIGSHAAYRVAHLKEIGGFAPSRAEDHLDTLRFAQAGYTGVFVPKNLAAGLGPHNLSDYLVQEHQWAFSIAQVLMKHRGSKGRLSWRQQAIFLFSELWYALFSLTYLVLFALPLFALATNRPIVNVPFLEFMFFSQPIVLVALLGLVWGYRRKWFRPGTHTFMSWQGIVLTVARWPIVLVALVNAAISVLFRGGAFTYMVTPKGARAIAARDMLRVSRLYILLGGAALALSLLYAPLSRWRGEPADASGYLLFTLLGAAFFAVIVILAFSDYLRANVRLGVSWSAALARGLPLASSCLALVAGLGLLVGLHVSDVTRAVSYWPGVLEVEAARPIIADAGSTPEPTPLNDEGPAAAGASTQVPAIPTATPQPTPADAPPQPTAPPAAVAASPVDSWLFDPRRQGVTFGAYDPQQELADFSGLTHLFMSWSDAPGAGIPGEQVRASYAAGRPVMLSVEPWATEPLDQEEILDDIAAGRYDAVILELARVVDELEQPVLIRFGHEMDLDGIYPWSGKSPESFIAAYRRVVDLFRESGVDNVLWVWSPAGTLDALDYYPGGDYVDYAGLTILQFFPWDVEAGYQQPRPFEWLIAEKYELLEPLGKPIIVAEAGVAFAPELKEPRLTEMIEILPDYPLIRGLVYFNERNPSVAVTPYRPDWALTPDQVATLRAAIAAQPWIEGNSEFVVSSS